VDKDADHNTDTRLLSDQAGIPTASMEMIVVLTKMLAVVAVPVTTVLPGHLAK
jgi:hypothetical protein